MEYVLVEASNRERYFKYMNYMRMNTKCGREKIGLEKLSELDEERELYVCV